MGMPRASGSACCRTHACKYALEGVKDIGESFSAVQGEDKKTWEEGSKELNGVYRTGVPPGRRRHTPPTQMATDVARLLTTLLGADDPLHLYASDELNEAAEAAGAPGAPEADVAAGAAEADVAAGGTVVARAAAKARTGEMMRTPM